MYRLNLFILSEIASDSNSECAKDWKKIWIFDDEFDFGTDIPCAMCERAKECEAIALEDWIDESEFHCIDDEDEISDEDFAKYIASENDIEEIIDESDYEYGLEVSEIPGVKFCLRNSNILCYESCYDDQSFCETVVFLGYPEEKIKYPTAYPIMSLPKWAIGR